MWTDLPGEFVAGVDPACAAETDMVMLMAGLDASRRGESYLAWHRYQTIAVMVDRLVTTSASGFVMDGHADCAARIARQAGVSRRHAETLIDEAIALRDRLPEVADTLRDGVLSQWQIRLIISRTELIPADDPITPVLDAEIADTVRRRKGVWDRARLRDMVDRLVFRHDPDAVRQRRKDAMDQRGVWTHELPDGTAELTAVMSAENVRISAKAVAILADAVCKRDGRIQGIRRSDAMFALLTRTPFECQCDDEQPCTAQIPDLQDVLDAVRAEVVIHVVTDAATLAGAPGVGFLDEHGIISDEHVRDLAARPDATLTPVTPARTAPTYVVGTADDDAQRTAHRPAPADTIGSNVHCGTDVDAAESGGVGGTGGLASAVAVVYPATHPGNGYRPTASCADFVRVRDGYCTEPGCTRSAFACDLDHVTEYDHTDPARGGATSSENLNAKCRPSHLFKTHGDWVDVQYRDEDGRLVTDYETPEGVTLPGDAETLEDTFPNVRRIRFEQAAQAPPTPRVITSDNPERTHSRLDAKLARRRQERACNKRAREELDRLDPPPF
ncbi:HNH endonuclease [Gordonia McavH-238-E]|uniref:HNH endonuclease signature motif containing protein n=1 Tax=Gordonia sp. McavH-238-E TaxID=2917736 RepID=UPI001EF69A78|nr:HNH endonuclease signature motif containing protein [Gordonia sp. McavH-238-E]MCG7635238.1 HNH endonuclease [Gordonia sp. McavH-238-E]